MPVIRSKPRPRPPSGPHQGLADDASDRDRAGDGISIGWNQVGPLVGATLTVLIAGMLAPLLQRLPHASLSLLFLTAVIIVAARWGLWLSVYASLLSFLAYNFFFTLPLYTFAVEAEGDLATLVFFLAMAVLTGNLASRMRDAVARKDAAFQRISVLYDFSRRTAVAIDNLEIVDSLADILSETLSCPVVVLLPDEKGELTARSRDAGHAAGDFDLERARIAWRDEQRNLPGVSWTFIPLATANGRVGMVAIRREDFQAETTDLVSTLSNQAAVALERAALVADLKEARITSETEQFRSTLLSSVSHDLRTPLSSIIGSTTSLMEYGESLSPENRMELLKTVLEESERLNGYIQNLLDMTRLGRGTLPLHRDWADLNDIVAAAVGRMRSALSDIEVEIDIEPDAALVYVHAALLEQAFVNLIENAARFSPKDGKISISARRFGDEISIEIVDQGPGIPLRDREKIFDMLYSGDQASGRRKGTGLGLSICRSLIGAHGGHLVALDGPRGIGACMQITLPNMRFADKADKNDVD